MSVLKNELRGTSFMNDTTTKIRDYTIKYIRHYQMRENRRKNPPFLSVTYLKTRTYKELKVTRHFFPFSSPMRRPRSLVDRIELEIGPREFLRLYNSWWLADSMRTDEQ